MTLNIPKLPDFVIITENPYLAAEMSAALGSTKAYTPVVEAPRMTRPDKTNEVIRCINSIARYQPKNIYLTGLEEDCFTALAARIPPKRLKRIDSSEDIQPLNNPDRETIKWGKKDIGLGLLHALRTNQNIAFTENANPPIGPKNSYFDHTVICEDGDLMAQVIAANYAHAIKADLVVIPTQTQEKMEELCERFYSSAHDLNYGQNEILLELASELRGICSNLEIGSKKMLTFFSRGVPYGFAYPELPTTHLFTYPNLGANLVTAIATEQSKEADLVLALLIDPEQLGESEVNNVATALTRQNSLVRIMRGKSAKVYDVSRAIAYLPFDLLLISTHCGDASGWRWTYEYTDSEGIDRVLVVDTTIGVGAIPTERDMLEVMQLYNFISLDGVDWKDEKAKSKLYVGKAITDFINKTEYPDKFIPTKKEPIERVIGSSALKMADNNYLVMPELVGGRQNPIVINNACCSWHKLAHTFTFSGARTYIGTLFEVLDYHAQEIAAKVTGKFFGKSLAVSLWRAQNEVYGDSVKRPYVNVGPHFVRLRAPLASDPKNVLRKLYQNFKDHARTLGDEGESESAKKKRKAILQYLDFEMRGIQKAFFEDENE